MNIRVEKLALKERVEQAKAILAKAESEKRSMNSDETRKWETIMAEVDAKSAEIQTEERKIELEKAGILAAEARRNSGPDFVAGETRCFSHTEPVAGAFGAVPSEQRLSIGKMVRGVAVNRWEGADAELRALSAGLASKGGFTVPTSTAGFVVDLARAASVCQRAGAQILPMDGASVVVPAVATDPEPSWVAENQTLTVDDTMTFRAVKMEARELVCLLSMSLNLIEDSPLAAQAIETALIRKMALTFDTACLNGGAGGNALEPTGILNWTGINTYGAGSDALTHDDVSQAVQKCLEDNYTPNTLIFDEGCWGTLDRKKNGDGDPILALPSFNTLQRFTTTAMPATSAIVGDFTRLVLGVRKEITIEVSPHGDAFKANQLYIRARMRGDVCLLDPTAFCAITAITN